MSSNTRHYSLSRKDNWETPQETIDWIVDGLGHIDLDPCASPNTNHGLCNCRLEDGGDGLQRDWYGNIFLNPPFSYKKEWLAKLEAELEAGHVKTAVVITPDATDTKSWWHEYVAEHAEYICFRYGRLDFVDPDGDDGPGATFGTAFSVYGDVPQRLVENMKDVGHVVKTIR